MAKYYTAIICLIGIAFLCTTVSIAQHRGTEDFIDNLAKLMKMNCTTCKENLQEIRDMMDSGMDTPAILQNITDRCPNITELSGEALDVCEGLVELWGPGVVYILNNTLVDNDAACTFVLRGEYCNTSLPQFSVDIPASKPAPSHPVPVEGAGTIKILHISDFHIDYLYKEGTPVDCGKQICCRESNETVPVDARLAGYWGTLEGSCDLPVRTLELMLEQAALLNPDLVYVTGDHPPHDNYMQTIESNVGAFDTVNTAIFRVFNNTPILQSLGNHESVPVNSYPVPSVYNDGWDIRWLYNHMADTWVQGGIPAQNLETVRTGGFYTYSPLPGLRIVAVNMMYCYTMNFWLLMDNADPTGQLTWLVSVLSQAEQAGEKVHILDHISTGSRDCDQVWSHQINRVYSRFENTITAIFSGHNHFDQFRMLWDVENNSRPIGLSYLVPSVTELERKSPAFRLYTVDGGYADATWLPVDFDTYTLNLTEANSGGEVAFKLRYSAREAYGLSDLTPDTWAQLGWQMATNDTLFAEYIRHYFNYWEEPPELLTCDVNCRKELLCSVYRGDSSDLEPCNRIREQVDLQIPLL